MNTNKPIWIVALLVLLTAALTAASYDAPNNNEGIRFFEGTWSEAVKKSKEENKPIFLDVYATWCGPCKMLKRNTFSDKGVGEYFNTHFINVSIDGEEEEGRKLMEKFNLRAYPSLLVIDQHETAQVVEAGYKSPNKLIDFGKKGLEKLK
jgi:thiol:disulfide interchange protein